MDYDSLSGYGKDNWIKYKWNRSYENPYPSNDFECFLRPKGANKIVPMDVATSNAVADIHETHNKKIYLAMSGGIDSEYVADILIKQRIKFTPIVVTLNKENSLDTWWAFRWCKQNNVEPHIINIDESQYIDNLIAHSKKYCSIMTAGSVTVKFVLDYVNDRDGILLTGMGFNELYIPDPIMYEEEYDDTLKDSEGNTKHGYLQSEADLVKLLIADGKHPMTVLNWNPEVTLSYIAARDPGMTTEENRFKIFNCSPRPKIALPMDRRIIDSEKYKNFTRLIRHVGTTKSYYLGTTEKLIDLLSKGT
jgi:asparagine synthetase B (glutamine-hydrolysing)